MDTCAATQDESDVEASNETSTDSCPRISNVSLSCRPFKSYAEYIASNAAFNLIIMFMLLFYLQHDFRLQICISFISTLRIILFIVHDYSLSSPLFLLQVHRQIASLLSYFVVSIVQFIIFNFLCVLRLYYHSLHLHLSSNSNHHCAFLFFIATHSTAFLD